MRCNTCLKQLGMIKWVKISRICRRGWPTHIKSCNIWQSIQVQACPKSSQRFHDINIMPRFHYQSLSITIIHVVLSLQLTHCRPEKMFQTQTQTGRQGKTAMPPKGPPRASAAPRNQLPVPGGWDFGRRLGKTSNRLWMEKFGMFEE